MLENLLRNETAAFSAPADITYLAIPRKQRTGEIEIAFTPARVLMQDFTGVPAIVDWPRCGMP